ncbi:endolytic transglycosylase MltG [Fluviispira multicolorata]|uniref:Endolytic murein transglycosylase n=1 Tax=Fluviispira multicolorata TaxID=2654512 RepID=A0A833N2L5_9BACT|nr:endolytic transglycosylase MltG [Fluviispira multicolorata]KAB8028456.1 endolytic transglycosylase MltG [Fluviispira multicolorata]
MLKRYIFLLFTIFVSFFVFTFVWFFSWLKSPNTAHIEPVEYSLVEGSTFMKVAYDLERQNVISHPKILAIYAKILNVTGELKVGSYLFPKDITPNQVLTKLVRGDIITTRVTIAEGLNIYQISELLSQLFPKVKHRVWLDLMFSNELIQYVAPNLGIKSLEGFIFPQTYVFNPNLPPKIIVKTFLSEFKKNVTQDMFIKAKKLGFSPLQYVTLASIVEKETGMPSERERIAGVYFNRLKLGMKLQADPTVIYGMWKTYKGSLTRKDLITPTPYNTYTQYGLPPGPIASPGLASFKATLSPISNDLYFVAKGDGTHIFSKSLLEHNKAVHNYVIFLKKSKKESD